MGTTLSTLSPAPGATRERKRVGRGRGSGTGKTAGRGQKGQKSRTGHHGARKGFEGGQMPLQRRLPKRGFKNPFRREAYVINVGAIVARYSDGVHQAPDVIDVDALKKAGLVPRRAELVKILGEGDVGMKLTLKAHAFSKAAQTKVEAAGGTWEVLSDKAVPAAQANQTSSD
jgi:large subunit ribosomal protein L15